MNTSQPRSVVAVLLVPLLLATLGLGVVQAQDEQAVLFEVEGGDRPMELKITSGSGGTRFDMMGAEEGEVSMVWRDDAMLMIMHSEQKYMEFTKEMMDRMKQMMGAMGRTPEVPEEVDVSAYSFDTTGNTDVINGMDAFEVTVNAPDGKKSTVWMTQDVEVGLFEAFMRMMKPMQEMSLPGMNNPMGRFDDYMALARANGMPDGRVIRVIDPDNGTQITMKEIIAGPFGDETFNAPAGYEKQAMPMMPPR